MQLEDRVAMLEQASRTHQEELVHVQAVVRGRQGSMMEDMRQLRSSMDVRGASVEVDLSSLREQLKRLGEEQGATVSGMECPSQWKSKRFQLILNLDLQAGCTLRCSPPHSW